MGEDCLMAGLDDCKVFFGEAGRKRGLCEANREHLLLAALFDVKGKIRNLGERGGGGIVRRDGW